MKIFTVEITDSNSPLGDNVWGARGKYQTERAAAMYGDYLVRTLSREDRIITFEVKEEED